MHATIRRLLRSLFDSEDFLVCGEAVNGLDAIEKAQELHPDLILLDLSMPIMNGLEAARQLTSLMPKARLMMLTNYTGDIVEAEAREAGILTVIPKDKAFATLITKAHELLA